MQLDPIKPSNEDIRISNIPPIQPVTDQNPLPNPNDINLPPDNVSPLGDVTFTELTDDKIESLEAEVHDSILNLDTTIQEINSAHIQTAPVRVVLRDWLRKRILQKKISQVPFIAAAEPSQNHTLQEIVFLISGISDSGLLTQKLSDIFQFASTGGLCYLEIAELPKLIGEAGTLIYRRSILSEAQDLLKEMEFRLTQEEELQDVLKPYIEDLKPWIEKEIKKQSAQIKDFLGNTLVATPGLLRFALRIGSHIAPVATGYLSICSYVSQGVEASYRLYKVNHETNAISQFKANLKKRINTPTAIEEQKKQVEDVKQAKLVLKTLVLEKTRQENSFFKFLFNKTAVEFPLVFTTCAMGIVVTALTIGGISVGVGLTVFPPTAFALLLFFMSAAGLYYLHLKRPHLFKTLFTTTPAKLAFYRMKLAFMQYQRLNTEIKQALNMLKIDQIIVDHKYTREELEEANRGIEQELKVLGEKIAKFEEEKIQPLKKTLDHAGVKDFLHNARFYEYAKDNSIIQELAAKLVGDSVSEDIHEFLNEYTGIDIRSLRIKERDELKAKLTDALNSFFGSSSHAFLESVVK